jgi:hypothetical protein
MLTKHMIWIHGCKVLGWIQWAHKNSVGLPWVLIYFFSDTWAGSNSKACMCLLNWYSYYSMVYIIDLGRYLYRKLCNLPGRLCRRGSRTRQGAAPPGYRYRPSTFCPLASASSRQRELQVLQGKCREQPLQYGKSCSRYNTTNCSSRGLHHSFFFFCLLHSTTYNTRIFTPIKIGIQNVPLWPFLKTDWNHNTVKF